MKMECVEGKGEDGQGGWKEEQEGRIGDFKERNEQEGRENERHKER